MTKSEGTVEDSFRLADQPQTHQLRRLPPQIEEEAFEEYNIVPRDRRFQALWASMSAATRLPSKTSLRPCDQRCQT